MQIMRYIFLLFLFLDFHAFAQDLDVYKVKKNSNFELPDIAKEMTFQEFELLSTNLRMQDMITAVILPGHVHFKIKEKKIGYYILGARSLGYASWAYLSTNNESLLNILFLPDYNHLYNVSDTETIVAYTATVLIIGSYLYDWIHGRYLLDKKQNSIRYKYAKKRTQIGFSSIRVNHKDYPALALIYNF